MTIQILDELKIPVDNLYSKSWERFSENSTPIMDYVVTVCHQASKEACPVWPGAPKTFHFNIEDPANKEDPSQQDINKFHSTYHYIDKLIQENLIK